MKLVWEKKELDNFLSRLSNVAAFEGYVAKACQELARQLRAALLRQTPVLTGRLVSGWGGNNLSFQAIKTRNGYRVDLINQVPYATYVNDGHYSYNQFGGPYIVKNRTVPYDGRFGGNNDRTFVFGHFFVEKSVLETEEQAEYFVYQWIDKWFRWCCGG